MRRTLVLDVVGLTPALLQHAPNLKALAQRGTMRPLTTVAPAVTTTVQSTFVTGTLPRDHGIVANGWYFRDLAEVWLWRQSNRLVHGERLGTGRVVVGFPLAIRVGWTRGDQSQGVVATGGPDGEPVATGIEGKIAQDRVRLVGRHVTGSERRSIELDPVEVLDRRAVRLQTP